MNFSLSVVFLLLLGVVTISLQNSMPLDLKFIAWNLQMPLTAMILYSSLMGGAIVAVLALPKLARKSLDARSFRREISNRNKKIVELEKGHLGGSRID